MKGRERWQPVTVPNKSATQSYVIKTLQGQVYLSNGQHLRMARDNDSTKNKNDTSDGWLDNNINDSDNI